MSESKLQLPVPDLPVGSVEGDRGLYSIADRPHPHVAPLVFVGGTGRSGTHIVARYLGRHGRIASIPVECRFHVEQDRGFPALLEGRTSKQAFLKRLRGFWWRGKMRGRQRGMHNFVPREVFSSAVADFDRDFDSEPEQACRDLFFNLLWPWAVKRGASGLVEQSCDVVAAAPTLVRLFPEAKFVHVVRDGRDASASRVAQTRGLVPPRTRRAGIAWWERRIRAIDAGSRAIPEDMYLEVGLEDLLGDERRQHAGALAQFAGVRMGRRMRRFLHGQINHDAANTERWIVGLSPQRRERYERLYIGSLDRLEADGVSCVSILRRTYERRASAGS